MEGRGPRQRVSALPPPGTRMMCALPVPLFLSEKHLPGFVNLSDELKANGVEVVACVSGELQPRRQGASWCIQLPSLSLYFLSPAAARGRKLHLAVELRHS